MSFVRDRVGTFDVHRLPPELEDGLHALCAIPRSIASRIGMHNIIVQPRSRATRCHVTLESPRRREEQPCDHVDHRDWKRLWVPEARVVGGRSLKPGQHCLHSIHSRCRLPSGTFHTPYLLETTLRGDKRCVGPSAWFIVGPSDSVARVGVSSSFQTVTRRDFHAPWPICLTNLKLQG